MPPDQAGQSCIKQFFQGQTATSDQAPPKPKPFPHPPTSAEPRQPSSSYNPDVAQQSRVFGEHPQGDTTSIPRDKRPPPPARETPTERGPATRGKNRQNILHTWRVQTSQTCEPRARSLVLHNPHNLCYANSVLHMIHYACSHHSQVTGLGILSGALTQAARTSTATNIARGKGWSCLWRGWRQPTHQHDAAEFLQHLCQQVECAALRGGWEARRREADSYNITDE